MAAFNPDGVLANAPIVVATLEKRGKIRGRFYDWLYFLHDIVTNPCQSADLAD